MPVIIIRITIIERAPIITARAVLVIIIRITIIERALIITAGTVPVIIIRIAIIERILVALEYKKGSKDKYYRLYQQ